MRRLIGKTIVKITHEIVDTLVECTEDGERITFKTNKDEWFCYDVEGDCCSQSWIESIEDTDSLFGNEVIDVVEKRLEEKDIEVKTDGNDKYIKFYTIDIITAKGTCTIDFRNESNGFYGGRLELNSQLSVFNRDNMTSEVE